jgi:hypothetical protein
MFRGFFYALRADSDFFLILNSCNIFELSGRKCNNAFTFVVDFIFYTHVICYIDANRKG